MFHQARLRNFTYCSSMTIDIHIQYIIRNVNLKMYKFIIILLKRYKLVNFLLCYIFICILSQYKHLNNYQTEECNMMLGIFHY